MEKIEDSVRRQPWLLKGKLVHVETVPSFEAVTTRWQSGLNCAVTTAAVSPRRVVTPVVLSREAVTTRRSSKLKGAAAYDIFIAAEGGQEFAAFGFRHARRFCPRRL